MIKVLSTALGDIDIIRKKFHAFRGLSPSAHTVLEAFKDEPEMRLQTQALTKKTALPRRTVLNAIGTLLKGGFIQKRGQGSAVRYQIVF